VDTTTSHHGPTPEAYEAACTALWAHRDRADALSAALASIRAWRHLLPHRDVAELGPLDAILDSIALDSDVPLRRIARPTNLPEAVAAHRAVMDARRQAIAATRLVWDQIEAAAIRDINRYMPRSGAA
jgi:hypothetical protein